MEALQKLLLLAIQASFILVVLAIGLDAIRKDLPWYKRYYLSPGSAQHTAP